MSWVLGLSPDSVCLGCYNQLSVSGVWNEGEAVTRWGGLESWAVADQGSPCEPGKVFELDPLRVRGGRVLQGIRRGHATVHRRFIALVLCPQVHTLCFLISTAAAGSSLKELSLQAENKQNNKFSREICALPKVLLAEWEERNLTWRYLGLWGQTVYSACCCRGSGRPLLA